MARRILPAHRMLNASRVQPAAADFVAYSEAELSGLTGSSGTLLPWGFAVRHCLNTACTSFDRTLPGNAAPTQYDGRVTLAFKTPLGATPSVTPRTVTALYAVYEDAAGQPKLTQTQEEQVSGTIGGLDSLPGGFEATTFPGSALSSGTRLGSLRTSGPATSPTAYLFTPGPTCGGAPGTLDPCFGNAGKVADDNGLSMQRHSMMLDAQGRILVAGSSYDASGSGYDFALARYSANGAPDPTFGTNGKVTTDFAGGDDVGFSVGLDSTGRILVAGYTNGASGYDFALARYSANGALDATFGTNGKVITDFAGPYDFGYSVALDSAGRILVAGQTGSGVGLIRVNP